MRRAPDTEDPDLPTKLLVPANYIKAYVEPMRYFSFNNATEHISIVQQQVRRKKVQGSQLRTIAAPPSVQGHRSRSTLQTGSEHRLIPHEHFPFRQHVLYLLRYEVDGELLSGLAPWDDGCVVRRYDLVEGQLLDSIGVDFV